jgi:membrane protease YdiL (CAAX protease family)
MATLHWSPEYRAPLAALVTTTLGFLTYLSILLAPRVEEYFLAHYGSKRGQTLHVLLANKWSGTALLGLFPLLLIRFVLGQPLSDYGAGPVQHPNTWRWMLLVSTLVLAMVWSHSRKPQHYSMYPLIRRTTWSRGLLLQSLMASSAFIIAYEFLFRGFLLFACLPLTGPWVAIALNVLIYALAHVHKGIGETLGSVPFGVLLCWVTLSTGTIWAATGIHLVMTLSADLFGLYFNPNMALHAKNPSS